MSTTLRRPGREFLADNPFPNPWTDGLFFREKMAAIHRVVPPEITGPLLDLGSGSSDLLARLYPDATVVSVDLEPRPPSSQGSLRAQADAVHLPFTDAAFGLVALFDVIEHIDDHHLAIAEARRVLRPGGWLIVSTPHDRWRYPRNRALRRWVRHEVDLMAEWGHVRRGYSIDQLDALVGLPLQAGATFGGLLVSPFHDISFSGWSSRRRRLAYVAAAIPVAIGWWVEKLVETGNELVRAYRARAA